MDGMPKSRFATVSVVIRVLLRVSRRLGRSTILRAVFLPLCLISPNYYLHSSRPAPGVQQAPLQYEVSVTLKLIQVYVTDKDGRPVRDLKKEDFVVFDVGKSVAVTEFEKHELLAPASGPETLPARAQPAPTPIPSSAMNRKLFLFFDFAYNNQKGVGATIKAALHFLDAEVLPDDEVALITYSSLKGLKVHEYLTRDHAKVRQAVADLSAKEIAGRAEEIEQMYWKAAEDGFANLSAQARYNLTWRRQEAKSLAHNYFAALTSLAKAMRLVEGQKTFIFFSTGTPYSLIYGGQAASHSAGRQSRLDTGGSTFDMGDAILRPLSEAMLKEFSASNCSFFSFDTRESAKVASLFAYEDMMNEIGGSSAFSADGVFRTKTDLLRDDKTTGQDALKRLSKETGGQYFSNISLYEKNLETVQNITGTYYVLGYPISAPKDGEFHKIKIEVKRKGCKLQTQAGYFDPKPFREYTDLEKQIQLFDLALNERSEGRAPRTFGVTALSYDAGSGPRLRLVSAIPEEALQGFEGKTAEFVSLVFDEVGNPVSLERTSADLAQYKAKEIIFTSGTAPPPGRYRCRIVVRDLQTGESAVGSTDVNIVKPASAELVLYSPLLLVPGEASTQLEAGRKGKVDLLSWQDVYPYDTTSLTPLTGDVPRNAGKVVVVVPFSADILKPLEVVFSAQLISMADGQSLPVTFYSLERSRVGAVEVQSLEFALDQVPPGKYQLYIHAADKDRGAQAQTHVPLVVRGATN
jgi:VWFA-related protein